jgi:hypothetical protein
MFIVIKKLEITSREAGGKSHKIRNDCNLQTARLQDFKTPRLFLVPLSDSLNKTMMADSN